MVRLDEFLACEPVDLGGQALCEASAVDEEQGGRVIEHQVEELWVDGGPYRFPPGIVGTDAVGRHGLLGSCHVGHGNDDLNLEFLLPWSINDGDRPRLPRRIGSPAEPSGEELGDCLQWSLCRGKADSLERRR